MVSPTLAPRSLRHYVAGEWISSNPEHATLLSDASTGQPLALASTEGIDMAALFRHAREVGNPALRKLTFHERGRRLKALALYLQERKEVFYEASWATGATRADAWIDIEGGIGNLFS